MKIWYSPCKTGAETQIEIKDNNTVIIDGEEFEFDSGVLWEDVSFLTNNKILEAKRVNNELYLKVFRGYADSCPWDSGTYHTYENGIEEILT